MTFVNTHFNKIALSILLVLLVQQCSNSSRISKLEKLEKAQSAKIESICTRDELVKRLEIEGLRAEKRMIQSTDRTMLDVNRQAEIDEILKNLDK